MKKKALVLTPHVKNCKRVGGVHSFIRFLEEAGYDIDWYVTTVGYSWLLKRNDKENPKNFFEVKKGRTFTEHGVSVRIFTVPMFFPAKVYKFLNPYKYSHYWPEWSKVKSRLSSNYNLIFAEQYAAQWSEELRSAYPTATIIYRPSDVLKSLGYGAITENPDSIEKKMIDCADVTLCVDETELSYYKSIGVDRSKLMLLRNPTINSTQIQQFEHIKPNLNETKSAVYIGVAKFDYDCVEYVASKNKDITFNIIGPFEYTSHDNVHYLGTMTEAEYLPYLMKASVGFDFIKGYTNHGFLGPLGGYTKKTALYMRYLLPVVCTNHVNYAGIDGFFTAKDNEEAAEMIQHAAYYTTDEREALREGYRKVFNLFEEEQIRNQFLETIKSFENRK